MRLTTFQIQVLRQLNWSHTPLGKRFSDAWNAMPHFDPLDCYQEVMEIKSPLMDEVRAHLVAQTLLGQFK